jgi:hypothetical protein
MGESGAVAGKDGEIAAELSEALPNGVAVVEKGRSPQCWGLLK